MPSGHGKNDFRILAWHRANARLVINHNLYPKLGYDPTEFVPIVIMGRVPNALVVNPRFPPNDVAGVIAYAKSNPGKFTSANQGNGSTSHLTSELFQLMAGVKFQHVPYRGSAPALTDLVGGSVDIMFDNLGVSLPLVKSGQLKLIAVASAKRLTEFPDVPTVAETISDRSPAPNSLLYLDSTKTREAVG